jgi:hypothetical protein
MPDHVHLLVSEPERGVLADAIHCLKLSFAKRLRGRSFQVQNPQVSTHKDGREPWGIRHQASKLFTFSDNLGRLNVLSEPAVVL